MDPREPIDIDERLYYQFNPYASRSDALRLTSIKVIGEEDLGYRTREPFQKSTIKVVFSGPCALKRTSDYEDVCSQVRIQQPIVE